MLSADQLKQFEDDGFLVLPGFLSDEEIASLESARARLVQQMDPAEHQVSVFSCHEDRIHNLHAKDAYFLHSGDKVRFFWEEGGVRLRGPADRGASASHQQDRSRSTLAGAGVPSGHLQ